MFTVTCWNAAGKADLRAFKLCSAPGSFCTIAPHAETCGANGNPITIQSKVIFIDGWTTALIIQVNKGLDALIPEVLIESHGIMSRIQEKFGNIGFRKELLHGKPVVEKTMGVMS